MTTIDLMHGSVTTRTQGSLDIFVKYRREAKAKELAIFEALKDPKSELREDGGILEIMNSSTYRNGKNWVKRRVTFPNGCYVTFTFVQRTSGVFSQSLHNMAIAPRDTAPLHELAIKLPFEAGKNTMSMAYVVGRFDILSLKDIQKLGLHISSNGSNDLSTYDLEDFDILDDRIKEEAVRQRVKAKTVKTGKGGSVTRIRRPRRINL